MSKRMFYYEQGFEDGKRAERERIKRAIDGNPPMNESSTLWTMIWGSIILTLCGWCFVGLILFLLWFGGESESWWFSWIWHIAFWGGIGFIILMSIAGVVMTISEHYEAKNPPEKPANLRGEARVRANEQNLWKKKYYSPTSAIKPEKINKPSKHEKS